MSYINQHINFDIYSMIFDGGDEVANIDGVLTNELATTTKGTFSTWVKPVTALSSQSLIVFGDTNANAFIRYQISGAGLLSSDARVGGVTQWLVDTDVAAFSDGVWAHIALVQDGVSPVLYVNAAAVAQAFTTSIDKTIWFNDIAGLDNGRLAAENFNSGGNNRFFNGHMDEVSIWDADLSSAEIGEIYNGGTPTDLLNHSKVANLSGWYRCGDNASYAGGVWTMTDNSANTNNAVSVNMEEADREFDVP